jgi:hypothetical protein
MFSNLFSNLPSMPVPSQEPGVRGYLQNLLAMTPGGFPAVQGYTYRSVHDFVLDRGKVYASASLTTEERRVVTAAMGRRTFAKKACFYNAHMLAMNDTSGLLVYTEGFAFSQFMPMHHGWVTLNGKVVDVTWDEAGRPIMGALPEGWEYLGVEFTDRNMLRERMVRRKEVHAVIDDPQDGFPVLKWDRLTP